MRGHVAGAALVLAVLACADSPHPTKPAGQLSEVSMAGLRDRYIVTLHAPADPRGIAKLHGVTPDHVFTHVLNGFAAHIPEQALQGLRRNPHVALIEPDGIVTTSGEQAGAPWGLDRSDQRGTPLDGWYRYPRSGSGVTVYIIDSGINTSHVDFSGRIGAGADFTGNGTVEDCMGHGTHVAGIAGGTTYGMAKAVTLVPLRVFGCTGSTAHSTVIAAVDWATQRAKKPAVVNMSLGGGYNSSLHIAVQNSIKSGLVYVVAAGNNGSNGFSPNACHYSPASVPEALTVAASMLTSHDNPNGVQDDMHVPFSNSGPCVDLYAPGTYIMSAWIGSGDTVRSASGTSMASPHVAGAAAKVLEGNPSATPKAVHDAIVAHATKGVVQNVPTKDTPNLLLHIGATAGGGTAPPPDDGGGGGGSTKCPKGWQKQGRC